MVLTSRAPGFVDEGACRQGFAIVMQTVNDHFSNFWRKENVTCTHDRMRNGGRVDERK